MRSDDQARGNGHLTMVFLAETGGQVLDCLGLLERRDGQAVDRSTGVREPHVAADPVQEEEPQRSFEPAHLGADRALGKPEGVGGPGEVFALRHRDEDAELVESEPGRPGGSAPGPAAPRLQVFAQYKR